MKTYFIILGIFLTSISQAQIDTLQQRMVSMNETIEKPYKVGSIYYKSGESAPFTGVLFGKYSNGQYLSIQEYKNGIGNGTWINYYEDGTTKEIGTYVDNRVEGPIEMFYPNGVLKARGTYAHWRKKVSKWSYYDVNGILVEEVTY